jgi:hypothetical protein
VEEMSAAYDVALYIAQTLGKGTLAVDVFCNDMPDQPTNCIAVYGYGGSPSVKGMGTGTAALEHPNVQVDVRNANPSQADSIAKSIHDSFDSIGVNVSINGTVYTWLHPLQPPFLLERTAGSDGERVTFVFNMEVQARRA